jgi:integrase-like protein/helix-turn-helix protein
MLRQQLIELAHEKPRFGYRRLHILLRRTGQRINHKRVQRVYRAARLCVRRIRRKRLTRSYVQRQPLAAPNQEWAIDFANDIAASGQRLRVFSVVDAFTRECLALETDTSMPSRRVTRVLQRIINLRGAPQFLRSDNVLNARSFLLRDAVIVTTARSNPAPLWPASPEHLWGRSCPSCQTALPESVPVPMRRSKLLESLQSTAGMRSGDDNRQLIGRSVCKLKPVPLAGSILKPGRRSNL